MGLSVRYFLVDSDDLLVAVPIRTWERLHEDEADEKLSAYAGSRVRFLRLDIELKDRRPSRVLAVEGGYRTFDADGRVDLVAMSREARALMDFNLGAFANADAVGQEAAHLKERGRFARAQFAHEFRWEPTPELRARAEALALGLQSP